VRTAGVISASSARTASCGFWPARPQLRSAVNERGGVRGAVGRRPLEGNPAIRKGGWCWRRAASRTRCVPSLVSASRFHPQAGERAPATTASRRFMIPTRDRGGAGAAAQRETDERSPPGDRRVSRADAARRRSSRATCSSRAALRLIIPMFGRAGGSMSRLFRRCAPTRSAT